MNREETMLQARFLVELERTSPTLRALTLAIPNGLLRSPAARKRAMLEGMLPGAPDLFIAWPTENYAGLWLEFKTNTGTSSPAQVKVQQRLVQAGYQVKVVRSVQEAMAVVLEYADPVVHSWLHNGSPEAHARTDVPRTAGDLPAQ